jgi:hypothetical protein
MYIKVIKMQFGQVFLQSSGQIQVSNHFRQIAFSLNWVKSFGRTADELSSFFGVHISNYSCLSWSILGICSIPESWDIDASLLATSIHYIFIMPAILFLQSCD